MLTSKVHFLFIIPLCLLLNNLLVHNPLWYQIPSNTYKKVLSNSSILGSCYLAVCFPFVSRKPAGQILPQTQYSLISIFQMFGQAMFPNQNALLLPLHQTLSFKILLKIHLHKAFSNDLHPLLIIPKKHPCKSSCEGANAREGRS